MMGWRSAIIDVRDNIPRHQSSYSQLMSKGYPNTSEMHRIEVSLPFSEGDWIPRVCLKYFKIGEITHTLW